MGIDNMRLRRWERELVNELLDWEYGNNEFLNQVQNRLAQVGENMQGSLTFTDAHQNQINQNTDAIKKLTATVEELLKSRAKQQGSQERRRKNQAFGRALIMLIT